MGNIREKIDKRDEELEARFLLGMKGKRNIVVVGVNPSTATIDNLDPTSKRIDNYCIKHNFDGWILINLYPQIDKDVEKLHTEKNDELVRLNLKYIECTLKEKEITLVAAWGVSIELRKYLKECFRDIDTIAKKYNHQWHCFELTKYGYPCHPLIRRKGFSIYKTRLIEMDIE